MSTAPFTALSPAVATTASATPAAVAMPAFTSPSQQVRISNPGANHVHLNFGDSSVTATATSPYIVLPGESQVFTIQRCTHFAAFASTGSPQIHLALGNGE